MRGSRSSTRLGVNALLTRLRSRVWSGGSIHRNEVGSLDRSASGWNSEASSRWLHSVSLSTCDASACLVMNSTPNPLSRNGTASRILA